jgi:hypothetical protein
MSKAKSFVRYSQNHSRIARLAGIEHAPEEKWFRIKPPN